MRSYILQYFYVNTLTNRLHSFVRNWYEREIAHNFRDRNIYIYTYIHTDREINRWITTVINTPRGKSQCLNVNRENNEREWHEKSEKRRDNSKIMDRDLSKIQLNINFQIPKLFWIRGIVQNACTRPTKPRLINREGTG